MNNKPTVHIVDDDADVRESLRMLLGSVGIPVASYPDADSFLLQNPLDADARKRISCLILDMRMPGRGGMALLEEISRCTARIPVIVVTGHGDIPMSVRAMKLGAVDFVTKPFNHQKLLDLIQDVLRDAAIQSSEPNMIEPTLARERWETLTPREREVFEQIVSGAANKVIAFDLGISIRTVETHRARIMEKLHARSLVDLVMLHMSLRHSA